MGVSTRSTSPHNDVNGHKPCTSIRTGSFSAEPSQRPLQCHVTGCAKDLAGARSYYQRFRLCHEHLNLPHVLIDASPCRFCQKCLCFHSIDDFDGSKKSCRDSLHAHNARRRKRTHADVSQDSDSTEDEAEGRGRSRGKGKKAGEGRRRHKPHVRRNIVSIQLPDELSLPDVRVKQVTSEAAAAPEPPLPAAPHATLVQPQPQEQDQASRSPSPEASPPSVEHSAASAAPSARAAASTGDTSIILTAEAPEACSGQSHTGRRHSHLVSRSSPFTRPDTYKRAVLAESMPATAAAAVVGSAHAQAGWLPAPIERPPVTSTAGPSAHQAAVPERSTSSQPEAPEGAWQQGWSSAHQPESAVSSGAAGQGATGYHVLQQPQPKGLKEAGASQQGTQAGGSMAANSSRLQIDERELQLHPVMEQHQLRKVQQEPLVLYAPRAAAPAPSAAAGRAGASVTLTAGAAAQLLLQQAGAQQAQRWQQAHTQQHWQSAQGIQPSAAQRQTSPQHARQGSLAPQAQPWAWPPPPSGLLGLSPVPHLSQTLSLQPSPAASAALPEQQLPSLASLLVTPSPELPAGPGSGDMALHLLLSLPSMSMLPPLPSLASDILLGELPDLPSLPDGLHFLTDDEVPGSAAAGQQEPAVQEQQDDLALLVGLP